jgi:cyclophilin family peptidyl-prolyl cis-trans isomerase
LQETAAGRVLPGTSGLQFVISLGASSEQTPYTIFACVVDGMDVVAKISRTPVTGMNAIPRVEIKKVTIRERTPSIEEMKKMSVVMETSLGNMKLQLLPAGAPNSVRSFLQHIRSGFYNGTAISRVMMKYYMIGGDHADWLPDNPNNKQVNLFSLWPVAFEAATEKHTRGTLSLIPENNFTKCRFSIISLGSAGLDGRNVPVARIVEGLDVLDKIAETEVDGDKPKQRIEVKKISVQ